MQAKVSKIFIAQQLQKGFATKKTFGPIELIKIGKDYYDEDGNWQSADFNA